MQTSKTLLVLALAALAVSAGAAHRSLLQAPAPGPACADTVAQVATDAGLDTLLAAAQAAGLTSTLADPGLAYTVFAPTNEAFESSLNDLNVSSTAELLQSPLLLPILQNHLTGYPLPAADLLGYGSVVTVLGTTLNITSTSTDNGTVVEVSSAINTANVIMSDVPACRSIVHVIDAVLIPDQVGP